MNEQAKHWHPLAIAILAIATAALGFGLLQADMVARIQWELRSESLLVVVLAWLKVYAGLVAILAYFEVIRQVHRVLHTVSPVVSNITKGPLIAMIVEMAALTGLFIFGFISGAVA